MAEASRDQFRVIRGQGSFTSSGDQVLSYLLQLGGHRTLRGQFRLLKRQVISHVRSNEGRKVTLSCSKVKQSVRRGQVEFERSVPCVLRSSSQSREAN